MWYNQSVISGQRGFSSVLWQGEQNGYFHHNHRGRRCQPYFRSSTACSGSGCKNSGAALYFYSAVWCSALSRRTSQKRRLGACSRILCGRRRSCALVVPPVSGQSVRVQPGAGMDVCLLAYPLALGRSAAGIVAGVLAGVLVVKLTLPAIIPLTAAAGGFSAAKPVFLLLGWTPRLAAACSGPWPP